MIELTADDVKVGHVYRGKRFKELFGNNDRYVLWISHDRSHVQYDSDTVRLGLFYPKITMEKFLKWVKEEVPFSNRR